MPPTMAQTLKTRYNVDVLHAWGMTELCPLGVASTPTPAIAELGTEEMQDILCTRQGRLLFGVELKIVDEEGASLPWVGLTPGVLKARGPWVIERYSIGRASCGGGVWQYVLCLVVAGTLK